MELKQQLKTEALIVNDLLSQYIEIHNHYLKSSGTFRSLFRKVNFRNLAGEAYFIFERLRDKRNEIEKLLDLAKDDKEKEFAECLFLYTKALTETSHLLFILLHALQEKAEGNELSLNEHMENNKKYQQSIKNYLSYGDKLNSIYNSLT